MKTTWEYKAVRQPDERLTYGGIQDILNQYGSEGWELCSIDYGSFIFKRKIKEKRGLAYKALLAMSAAFDINQKASDGSAIGLCRAAIKQEEEA